jgi:hypothetical protein
MAEFINVGEFHDQKDWVHGGVDWLEVLKLHYAENEQHLEAMALRVDGEIFTVNPETTKIFISACNDNMDCIIYTDPEDGKSWTWFREECGGQFQTILESIGHLACTIASPRPMNAVIDMFEDKADAQLRKELDSLDEFGL